MCFNQPLNPADDSRDEGDEEVSRKKKVQKYIFYDFECMLVDHQHVPNLCVLHKVCALCIEKPMAETCYCNREQLVFRGEDTLRLVGEWLFSGHNRGAICVAHNSQGYDAHLLLDYVHSSGVTPVLIENGKKIMSIEVKGMQFIDSLNYFTTALANLPTIFGLEEIHKGYFPHLFSIPENQEYSGEVPPMSYYDPEGMKPDRKTAFEEWWRKQMTFDFQADLESYCISDILRRCCRRFRSMFMEHTSVDPFSKSLTIVSA